MKKLLTRNDFRESVLKRDRNACVSCGSEEDLAVHHILERKLFKDGGYYLNNGASLCPECHVEAEAGFILPSYLFYEIGVSIDDSVYPEGMNKSYEYDKWGQEIVKEGNDGSFIVIPNQFEEKFKKAVIHAGGVTRKVSPEYVLEHENALCKSSAIIVAKLKELSDWTVIG